MSDHRVTPSYNVDPSLWSRATTYEELKALLEHKEQYIYIAGDVTIDVPNEKGALKIGSNQTVFSSRSVSSDGGRLLVAEKYDSNADEYPVIYVASGGRLSSLRIEGPVQVSDTVKKTIGIQTEVDSVNVMIDNSEIYGWPWTGVSIKKSRDANIHHNYIHHNIKSGLGYGVVVQNGHATANIECNIFDYNRHAVAGSGGSGEGYYATHNLVMQGGGRDAYHQFDMHADSDAPEYGGSFFVASHNWFNFGDYGTSNRSSIMIRGVPRKEVAVVTENKFKSNQQITSTTYTVTGAENAIPSNAELQQTNTFGVIFSFYKESDGLCFMNVNSEQKQVLCKGVGSQ